jgi:hypothetical protein
MASTKHFQTLPDYYKSADECKLNKPSNTNPRYKNFNQTYFTSGDVDQFYSYKDESNGENPDPEINFDSNVWYNLYKQIKDRKDIKDIKDIVENTDWEKYKNITTDSVDNTFKYIFDKFKKGIFIKIKNNKLAVFLPFSKHDYINEWSERIKVDPSKYKDIVSFIQYSSKLCGYDIPEKKINWKVNTWYGNNCLMRPEFPIGENDRGVSNLKDMLETLCNERIVPDIELFINKRDFPLITKSDYEPYEQIYDMENFRLISHKYNKYCPILSMVTSQKHSDIPMPTHEDWSRICSREEKFFAPDCRNYNYDFSRPWDQRIPTAVFRGASTGCGVTIENNPRLKISHLSSISPIEDGYKLLDAGITKWNLRPRKNMGNPYLQLIIPQNLPFWKKETNGLVKPLSPEEQTNYKYIVNVDGHVNAFRLSLELSMGSVVLLADSKYRMWYRRYLIPYVHYVPIKEDLSNLFEQIKWCREHDKECEEIAIKAKEFCETYLSKKGILDYLQYLFFRIKKSTGIYLYNTVKVEDIIKNEQEKILENYGSVLLSSLNSINYPFYKEDINYYSNEGLRLFISSTNHEMDEINEKNELIHKSHDTTIFRKKINDNLSLSIKRVNSEERKSQLVNEAFCGITEINNLIKEIPNFRFTYGLTKDKSCLVSEYIEGKTLKQFIMDGQCSVSVLKQILIMITLALTVAQEKTGFVHYDLYPWNIIIKELDKPTKITYQLKTDIITIETSIVPVIVDFGRSHIIHKHKHYGTIEPFKTSRIQDCFCIIVSCLFDIATYQRENFLKEINKAFYIVNFYSGTNFQKMAITKFPEMMDFLSKHKKYNEMIFGNKCDIEKTKIPYDLFLYLMNCKIQDTSLILNVSQYSYPDKLQYPFKLSHPSFYYDVISNKNPNISLTKYIEKIDTCYESVIGASTNKLIFCNISNVFSDSIIGVLDFIKLLEKMKVNEPKRTIDKIYELKDKIGLEKDEDVLKDLYTKLEEYKAIQKDEPTFMKREKIVMLSNSILQKIALRYSENYESKDEELCIPYFSNTMDFSMAKYNTKTFSLPEEILNIIQGNMILDIKEKEKIENYLFDMRSIMVRNFFYKNRFGLDQSDEMDIITKNKKIIKLSHLTHINYFANIYTLKYISTILYNQEKKILSEMVQKPKKILLSIEGILALSKKI